MSDVVAHQKESTSSEQAKEKRLEPAGGASNQTDLSNNSVCLQPQQQKQNHRQSNGDNSQTSGKTRQEQLHSQEDYVLEELKRLGKLCQSNIKPSMSSVRADLEQLASKLQSAGQSV